LNVAIKGHNEKANKKRIVGLVTEREFATFIAILLAPTVYGRTGIYLWNAPLYDSIVESGAINKVTKMTFHRFTAIKGFFISRLVTRQNAPGMKGRTTLGGQSEF
jgi:hypothetical protein